MAMNAVARQLQRTLAVLAEVEARNAAGLRSHRAWLAGQPERRREDRRETKRYRRTMADFENRIRTLRAVIECLSRGKQQ